MKICTFLQPDKIFIDVPIADKTALLQFVAEAGEEKGLVKSAPLLYEGLLRRESIMSTGIGEGIALPHTMSSEVVDPAAFLIRLKPAIEFESLDGKPVDVVIALLIPEEKTTLHLRILAGLSRLCRNAEFMKTIRQAQHSDTLWKGLCLIEEKMAFH